MYTSFFKLKHKPFQISSDPKFLWLGEKHKEAFATLKYGIQDNKGFLLLTGDVGTGKTTLINSLLESLGDDIICTSVTDPSLSKIDFFNYIAASFGIDREFNSKGAFLVHFKNFLFDTYDKGKKVLLIIDESQLLSQSMLEEVRLLSNIEKTSTKLINIFFVGQNEFNEVLNEVKNRAVRQRITLNYNIDPLTPEETGEYINHRLKVAGSKKIIFEESAMQEVYMYSGGFPRRINVICDHALLSGYVKDLETINAKIVDECAKELRIPKSVRNRDSDGFDNYVSKSIPNYNSQKIEIIEKEEESEGIGWKMVLIAVVFLLFITAGGWWVVSPKSFNQFVSNSIVQINQIKNKSMDLLSKNAHDAPPKDPIETEEDGSVGVMTGTESVNLKIEKAAKEKAAKEKAAEEKAAEEKAADEKAAEEKAAEEKAAKEKAAAEKAAEKKAAEEKAAKEKASKEKVQDNMVINTIVSSKSKIDEEPENIVAISKPIHPLPTEPIIIRFKYNSNNYTAEGLDKLNKLSTILVEHPKSKIVVSGYTDSDGSRSYNQKLGEFRANIVAGYLLGKGIKIDRITVVGKGNVNPIASNDTKLGRTMNRRVEIEITK